LFVRIGFVGATTEIGRQTRELAEERPRRELCPKARPDAALRGADRVAGALMRGEP
jgi:hypothetical protein